jgi:hypothetical protein
LASKIPIIGCQNPVLPAEFSSECELKQKLLVELKTVDKNAERCLSVIKILPSFFNMANNGKKIEMWMIW